VSHNFYLQKLSKQNGDKIWLKDLAEKGEAKRCDVTQNLPRSQNCISCLENKILNFTMFSIAFSVGNCTYFFLIDKENLTSQEECNEFNNECDFATEHTKNDNECSVHKHNQSGCFIVYPPPTPHTHT
jgi:hypothetical protein